MEGGVVTGHGPDDGDEAHEHADAGGEVDAFVDGAPDGGAVGEAGEAALWAVGAGGDEDENDGECEDIEGGADGVDGGERFGREGGHGAVDEHDERCQEEGLVVGWNVVWILNGGSSEDHGCSAVVYFLSSAVFLQ